MTFGNVFVNAILVTVCAALFLISSGTEAAFAFSEAEVEEHESIQQRLDRLEEKVSAPQIRPNLFNPSITAFGNFLTCGGQGYPKVAEGLCEQPFVFREAELDIRASIDPWADGVFILAIEPGHAEPGHDHPSFSIEIEEAYVTLKKLPFFNTAPLGMQLKAGQFRIPFGRFNQIHLHDLPQTTLPLSMQTMLGEHGLSRPGFSSQFLIPTPGATNALSATFQVLGGGGLPQNKDDLNSRVPAFLGHLAWFWDLAPSHDIEVGVSGYVEPRPNRNPVQMYGVDLSYKWRPYVLGEKRSFLFGGEAYAMPTTQVNWGSFVWGQYQFNQWTYLGVRYDYRHVGTEIGHTVGTFLTYYTTEFLRLRAGYEAVTDAGLSNLRNNFLLEINFIIGSHPVEPYWVNR